MTDMNSWALWVIVLSLAAVCVLFVVARRMSANCRQALRSWYNFICGVAAFVIAIWSLQWAVEPVTKLYGPEGFGPWSFGPWVWNHEQLGKAVVGFWGLAPPLFFWVDWVWLCSYLGADDPEREVAKHTHDLSRNIWIAFGVILVALFGLHIPFGKAD